MVHLSEGYKFALIAVPGAACPELLVRAADNVAASRHLPDRAIETWIDHIGSFHAQELQECELFLWVMQQSQSPDIVDGDNSLLGNKVYDLYLGVLISTDYFWNGRLTCLTGANTDGVARARSLATYSRSYRTLGAPHHNLTTSKIKAAAKVASQLEAHAREPSNQRMIRAIRTFREATEAVHLDQRLHQFVRSIEAFVVPPFKNSAVEFARRLCRVCAGEPFAPLKELYDLRCGIEHLHGPYDRMPQGLSAHERRTRLAERCIQAEALARFILRVFLAHSELWHSFISRASIDAFWQLPDAAFSAAWPSRLAFGGVLNDVDYGEIDRSVDQQAEAFE
jgi:hypothetical protein